MRKALIVALIASSGVLAQGRGPRQSAARGSINMSQLQFIDGAVSAVRLAYGAQYPLLEIAGKQIKIAPAWFFLENDFELRAGDRVRVEAAPCQRDTYLHAVRIVNTDTNATIQLRDSNGAPLWSRARGRGARSGAAGQCIKAGSETALPGTIESVTYGAGIEMPVLVVRTDTGELVTIKIGPERVLLEADVELQPAQPITVRAAYSTCRDEYIALELTLADGRTVVLREDDGTPVWD